MIGLMHDELEMIWNETAVALLIFTGGLFNLLKPSGNFTYDQV
jgi:hypothetical protein